MNTGSRVVTLRLSSHISCLRLLSDAVGCVAVGTQDGTVVLYDLRDFRHPVFARVLHEKAVAAAVEAIEDGVIRILFLLIPSLSTILSSIFHTPAAAEEFFRPSPWWIKYDYIRTELPKEPIVKQRYKVPLLRSKK